MTQLQSSSAATAGAPIKLREMLEQCEVRLAETGCYDGVTELTLKAESPLKYESLHTRLRSSVVSARETSKRISASPGVREVGESVVGLYTPEGDSVVFDDTGAGLTATPTSPSGVGACCGHPHIDQRLR